MPNLSPNIGFEPLQGLFEEGAGVTKDLLKDSVLHDLKLTYLAGIPEVALQINFSPDDGSDILIQKVDPKNALGYSVYADEQDYFAHLSASLHEPSESDAMGGTGG